VLISLKVKNFRSIREDIVLNMEESPKCKDDLASNSVVNGRLSLLTSAIIYGRNSAGKSNILKAFRAIEFLVKNSDKFKHHEKIRPYEPFLFDKSYNNKNVEFEICFIAENNLKYKYDIKYNKDKITYEALYFYPKGFQAKLFERELDSFDFGEYYRGEKQAIIDGILPNQLFLSKSSNKNIIYLKEAYLFFISKLKVSTFHDTEYDNTLIRAFSEMMVDDKEILENIKILLKAADTNILDFNIVKNDQTKFKFPDNIPNEVQQELKERYKYEVKTNHPVFENGKNIGSEELLLQEESLGTKKLLAIGGLIVTTLRNGGVIVIDELDKSLHPLVTKLLVSLFNSKDNNPNNAQLIFATHDSSLLDNELFRRDQVFFVEKEYEGNTILFRLSDINGVRKDVPFDKWYLSGRFRAIPVISNICLIYKKNAAGN